MIPSSFQRLVPWYLLGIGFAIAGCGSDSEPSSGAGAAGSAGGGAGASSGGSSAHAGSSGSSASGGSGGSSGSGTAGTSSGGTGTILGALIPSPLVSRDKPIESPQEDASKAFDGAYDVFSSWSSALPAADGTLSDTWVKVNVGSGPTKLLLVWHHNSTPNYTIAPGINYGAPTAYTIAVSDTGADDSFTNVVEVTPDAENTSYRARGHSFDFTGMSWVRLTIDKLVSEQTNVKLQISEIDIHDVSEGINDSYAVLGAGATRFAYDGHVGPLFPELVHAAHSDYYPALVNIADNYKTAGELLQHLDQWLALNPDFHHFILEYGLNEAGNDGTPEETNFQANLQTAIDTVKAAGKVPLIPRLPKTTDANHQNVAAFNEVIDQLVSDNELPAAPDFYAWFEAHPEQFCMTGCETQDHVGVDPSDDGYKAINELWAETLDPAYAK